MDYNVIRTHSQNAYKYYNNCDSRYISTVSSFFKEGVKNPSVALMIMNDEVNKYTNTLFEAAEKLQNGKHAPIKMDAYSLHQRNILNNYIKKNKQGAMFELIMNQTKTDDILKNKIIKLLPEHKHFFDTFEKLYPNSKDKRLLITYLSMDKVIPKKTWAEKVLALYPINQLNKNYPKTQNLRIELLEDGRIQDNKILPKIKNYIQRQKYKKLLHNTKI